MDIKIECYDNEDKRVRLSNRKSIMLYNNSNMQLEKILNKIKKLYSDFDIVFTDIYDDLNSKNIINYQLEITDAISILLDLDKINTNIKKLSIYDNKTLQYLCNQNTNNIDRLIKIVLKTLVKNTTNCDINISVKNSSFDISLLIHGISYVDKTKTEINNKLNSIYENEYISKLIKNNNKI